MLDKVCSDSRNILQWIEGIDDNIERNSSNKPVPGTKFYLIATQWYEEWKTLTLTSNSNIINSTIKPIDNTHMIDQNSDYWLTENEKALKNNLKWKIDYELIPKKAWDALISIFKCTPNSEIIKDTILLKGNDTFVEVYSLQLHLFLLNSNGKLDFKTFFISYHTNIRSLYVKIRRLLRVNANIMVLEQCLRIWKLDSQMGVEEFNNLLESGNKEICGKILENDMTRIEECGLADNDNIFIEIKCVDWVYKEKSSSEKPQNTNLGVINVEELCRKISLGQDFNLTAQSVIAFDDTKKVKNGLTGLRNLGNTCYMNSGLQCLFNTIPLIKYINKSIYIKDINKHNPLGTQGKLILEFAFLLKNYWYENISSLVPTRFKQVLSNFASQFSGSGQHDSQEFLSFLIDGLHEDVNQAKYLKNPKPGPGIGIKISDTQQGEMFWQAHNCRNNSFFVDNMHGQFKSTITCPFGHVSLAFDPFLMISLPLLRYEPRFYKVIFIPKGLKKTIFECKIIEDGKKTIKNVKEYVANLYGVSEENLQVAEMIDEYVVDEFLDDDEIADLTKVYVVYEIDRQSSGFVIMRKEKNDDDIYLKGENVSFMRIIEINGDMTGLQIHKLLYESFEGIKNFYYSSFEQYLISLTQAHSQYSLSLISTDFTTNKEILQSSYNLSQRISILPTEEFLVKVQNPLNKIIIEILWKNPSNDRQNDVFSYKNYIIIPSRPKVQSTNNEILLQSCIDDFCKEEKLDIHNTVFCRECKIHTQGYKKMEIWRLPKVLIFHLKRFKQMDDIKIKDKILVDFPIKDLNLTKYCKNAQGLYDFVIIILLYNVIFFRVTIYDLYAVSNHYGEKDYGHYTSFIYNYVKKKWYEFDDENVREIDESEVVGPGAYVLFYKIKDKR